MNRVGRQDAVKRGQLHWFGEVRRHGVQCRFWELTSERGPLRTKRRRIAIDRPDFDIGSGEIVKRQCERPGSGAEISPNASFGDSIANKTDVIFMIHCNSPSEINS